MAHLQFVFLVGDIVDGIGRQQGYGELGDDLAGITDGCDVMDGHARLCLTSCLHRLVDMMAPHALATILGQECGMDIDDATREGIDEEVRDQGQEACQDNEIDGMLAQQRHHDIRIVELCLWGYSGRHTQALSTHQGIGIGLVTDD